MFIACKCMRNVNVKNMIHDYFDLMTDVCIFAGDFRVSRIMEVHHPWEHYLRYVFCSNLFKQTSLWTTYWQKNRVSIDCVRWYSSRNGWCICWSRRRWKTNAWNHITISSGGRTFYITFPLKIRISNNVWTMKT